MDNYNPYAVPTTEPSTIYPVGAILEDHKGVYKVLKFEKQNEKLHKYQVEVLKQKKPVPPELKRFIDEKTQWLLILPQNLPFLKRIE